MFISFIVPVYNVENYVKECVDSLLAVSTVEFEILLVIGESNDKSNEICYTYEKLNSRIHVICQDGKGLSNARNCGLKVAQGTYIIFIDSDDYIVTQSLEYLLQYLSKFPTKDVFVSDFVRVFEKNRLSENHQIETTNQPIVESEYLEHFLKKHGCFWNVWRYVYKRDFLQKQQLWFKENVFSEDVDYTIRVMLSYPQWAFFHNPYYSYRVRRPLSLMNMNTFNRLNDTITIVSDCATWAAESDHPYRQHIVEHMMFEWVVNIAGILELPTIDRSSAIQLFLERKNILKLSHKKFYGLFALLIHCVGIYPIAVCLQLAKKARRVIQNKL